LQLFHDNRCPWILKGGYAMELRLSESRTTRDIDLGTRRPVKGTGSLAERILATLQDAAATDLGDFFNISHRPGDRGSGRCTGTAESAFLSKHA